MTYAKNSVITATDFNNFRNSVRSVYGTGYGDSGYGQTAINIPSVVAGGTQLVRADEWTKLRQATAVCSLHQNGTNLLLPPTTDLEIGDTVIAYDGVTSSYNLPAAITSINTNRLNALAGSMTTTYGKSIQTRDDTWTRAAETVVDVTFNSGDDARYFFNSGGQVHIRPTFRYSTANTVPPQTSTEAFLEALGAIVIDHDSISTLNAVASYPSAKGYYQITRSLTEEVLYTAYGDAEGYPVENDEIWLNTLSMKARLIGTVGANGDRGNVLRIYLRMTVENDIAGNLTGLYTVYVDEVRASTYVTAPSFNVSIVTAITNLTTGNADPWIAT